MSIFKASFTQRLILALIFLLALSRGGIYASFMPPWGLLDEEQHLHYIQYLVEQRATPHVGETYLSPEIIQSVFETRRHAIFHWPTPKSRDPQEMGLEGHSYEGYQPPLFYVLAAPLYALLPDDMLLKVYGLRWGMVALSLLTLWFAYRSGIELFPNQPYLVYSICLLLVVIPERTMSTARINNDVLLEIIAAALVWLCIRTVRHGLSLRRSQLLGLLFGAGVLTKTSMLPFVILLAWVFWSQRHNPNWRQYSLWAGGIATLLILPLLGRNLYLYGDLTGVSGFKKITNFAPPEPTWFNGLMALADLFGHFWVIWWKGSQAAQNWLLGLFYLILAGIGGFSLTSLLLHLRQQYRSSQAKISGAKTEVPLRLWVLNADREVTICLMFMSAIMIYGLAVWLSYFTGDIPIIQGRFLLPVLIPIIILFSWGLWHTRPGRIMLLLTIALLVSIDAFSLFGNLMLYFYYWSYFAEHHIPQLSLFSDWAAGWEIFYARFLSDKPPALYPVLFSLLLLYPLIWISMITLLWREHKGETAKLQTFRVTA